MKMEACCKHTETPLMYMEACFIHTEHLRCMQDLLWTILAVCVCKTSHSL
jgi:hypothetical protein